MSLAKNGILRGKYYFPGTLQVSSDREDQDAREVLEELQSVSDCVLKLEAFIGAIEDSMSSNDLKSILDIQQLVIDGEDEFQISHLHLPTYLKYYKGIRRYLKLANQNRERLDEFERGDSGRIVKKRKFL